MLQRVYNDLVDYNDSWLKVYMYIIIMTRCIFSDNHLILVSPALTMIKEDTVNYISKPSTGCADSPLTPLNFIIAGS